MNYEIAFWLYLSINIVVAVVAQFTRKKKEEPAKKRDELHAKGTRMLEECIKSRGETMEKYSQTLDRENYLLKTMNDAMNVTEPKGFMAQRMRNAPKNFKAKTEEEVNPDIVD